jgi:hypothetical protein
MARATEPLATPPVGHDLREDSRDGEPDPRDTALVREAWAAYGDDIERRLADLEAGRHPYQRPR